MLRKKMWTSTSAFLLPQAKKQHFRKKQDIDGFFNNIDHGVILDSFQYISTSWRERFGRRHNYIAVPRMKKPAFGGSVRCGDRILGLRMKKEILSKYAHSCRSQSNSKVKAADFFVIAFDHIWKNIEFDLEFGYSRFGATLLSFDVGITQGSLTLVSRK